MTELQIEKIYEIKNRAENFLSELLENERQADVYGETENDDKVFQSKCKTCKYLNICRFYKENVVWCLHYVKA